MKAIVLSLILFLPCLAAAQDNTQQQKDSLWKALTLTEGKEKLDTYYRLQSYYWNEVYDEQKRDTLLALLKNEEAETESKARLGAIKANILRVYSNAGLNDEVIERAPEILKQIYEQGRLRHFYQAYSLLVDAYFCKNDMETAMREARNMYDHAVQRQDAGGMGIAFYSMSRIYGAQRRPEEKINSLKECIALLKDSTNYLNVVADACTELGFACVQAKRYDDALAAAQELEEVIPRYEEASGSQQPNALRMLYEVYTDIYSQTEKWDKAEFYLIKQDSLANGTMDLSADWARIFMGRGRYDEALAMIEKAIETDVLGKKSQFMRDKLEIMIHRGGHADETFQVFCDIIADLDAVHNEQISAQLDEIRTQYEVNKHIAEKVRNRNYFLFALGGCALLLILLGVWIYFNIQIKNKNRILVRQIKELQHEQDIKRENLLQKTTFEIPENEQKENSPPKQTGIECPESRKDKLCLKLRDLLLKEKIYHDETLSRDSLTERLSINRHDLEEAFLFCFDMHFAEYINLLRLDDAIVLIENSDLSMEEISEKVGYGTVRTFQRNFAAKYNMSPKDYRKLAKERNA